MNTESAILFASDASEIFRSIFSCCSACLSLILNTININAHKAKILQNDEECSEKSNTRYWRKLNMAYYNDVTTQFFEVVVIFVVINVVIVVFIFFCSCGSMRCKGVRGSDVKLY